MRNTTRLFRVTLISDDGENLASRDHFTLLEVAKELDTLLDDTKEIVGYAVKISVVEKREFFG